MLKPFHFFLNLFLPVLFISGLMYVSMNCLMHSAILFDKNSLPREEIMIPLRMISYLTTAGFLLLAYWAEFKKLFVWTVGVFAGWICVLGLCLLPFHEALQARTLGNWLLEHGAISLSLVVCHWVHLLFYITLDIFNAAAITLIVWGVINQISQFREAFRYYIPLAFTLSTLAELISFGFNFLQVKLIIPPLLTQEIYHDMREISSWLKGSHLFLIASFSLICVLLIFQKICGSAPKERWKTEPKLRNFHFTTFLLSVAVLFFGLSFSEELFETPFQEQLAIQFKSAPPEEFMTFMAIHSFRTGGLTVIVKIISMFLGTWLLRKQGWIPTSLSAALVILGSGILVWSVALISGHFPISISFIHRAIYAGFRTGLFFALIQMTYLKIPRHERFFAMSLVGLAMTPLLGGLGAEVAKAIPLQFPSQTLQFPALTIFFVLTILILMRSISFLGKSTGLSSFHLRKE